MKKPQFLIKSLLCLGLFSVSLTTISCKEEAKVVDPKEVAEEENEAKFEENDNLEDDAELLVDAAEFDLLQIELAKMAQAMAVSAEVKDLATMIESHHNTSLTQVTELAKLKQISVPQALTEDGEKEYDRLKKVEAKNFDKEYLQDIAKDHTKAIEDFKKEMTQSKDADIKTFFESKMTSLNEHYKSVVDLEAKITKK